MRFIGTHGANVGGLGWRLLATTDGLTTAAARFGADAIAEVKKQAMTGHVMIGKVKFPIHKGEPAEAVLRRLEWLSYAAPAVS